MEQRKIAVLQGRSKPGRVKLPKRLASMQESRKFGGVIAEGAKSGAPELSSWVVSFMRLFSSDGILRAERPGGGASLCE